MFFPPQNETLTYDEDGNLTSDARWMYTWDAENRLVAMEEKIIANASPALTAPARKRLEFTYDHQHRRVRKVLKSWNEGLQDFEVVSDRRYLYDEWNLIAEFAMNAQTSNLELFRSYAWGLDLSGTEQGAGGVGGLLLVHQPGSVLAPCYDPNGNITSYIDCATGRTTHAFEYDPFGAEIGLDALLTASTNAGSPEPPAFRFSTKYTDGETSMVYYGYRYYGAEMGRWLNRDPIAERGGVNLYGWPNNDMVNNVDPRGLTLLDALKRLLYNQVRKQARKTGDKMDGADGDCGGTFIPQRCLLVGRDEETGVPLTNPHVGYPVDPNNHGNHPDASNYLNNKMARCHYQCKTAHYTSEVGYEFTLTIDVNYLDPCPEEL